MQVLVRLIADSYARANGLSRLTKSADKFAVVRSVFRELDKSTMQPGVPFFPNFADLKGEKNRSVASSLLDINVESSGGELEFVKDSNFALSITQALVIVLINLLHTEADISWDWHKFESIVMLNELKRMIVNTKKIPRRQDKFVLELQNPLPESAATKNFFAPLVGNCTVILNGARAGYADVIAPYRLVQAKFSIYDSTTVDLDIEDELDKMGVTTLSKHVFKQFLTDVIYTKLWASQEDAPEVFVDTKVMSTKRKHRHECYPLDMLNGRRVVEKPVVVGGTVETQATESIVEKKADDKSKDEAKNEATDEAKDEAKDKEMVVVTTLFIEENGTRQVFSPIKFDKMRPVMAVFATNCKAFRLIGEKKKAVAKLHGDTTGKTDSNENMIPETNSDNTAAADNEEKESLKAIVKLDNTDSKEDIVIN